MFSRKALSLAITLVLCLAVSATADSFKTKKRTVTKLADGVYAIRHQDPPNAFVQGNTLVVIGDREVFVVDSTFLPSSAREDIAEIRQWTDKPVRYVLNTHWHGDHWIGNAEYRNAFPGVVILAQVKTVEKIAASDPGRLLRIFAVRADRARKMLADGKDAGGKPLTPGDIADLNTIIQGTDAVLAELTPLQARPSDLIPSMSFDHDVTFDIGNREVQVKFLGRGNTEGDAIAYLPKEKIVATGDLLDHPIPYLGGGFPQDQIETLKRIAALDIHTIVPGHGDPMNNTAFLNMTIDFIQEVVNTVDKLLYDPVISRSPELMQKAVEERIDVAAWRQKFAGSDPDDQDEFNEFSLPGVIKAAYYRMWGR